MLLDTIDMKLGCNYYEPNVNIKEEYYFRNLEKQRCIFLHQNHIAKFKLT